MITPSTLKDADGRDVEIVTVDAEACSPAQVHAALRVLTRLLVRQYRETGAPVANPGPDSDSSALTVLPQRSPDRGDEAA